METGKRKWICAQLGAREHYAVARALHRNGALQGLFTDAWVRPGNPLGLIKKSLRERYHSELADATVHSANVSLLAFEAWATLKALQGWNRIMARNEWFQKQVVRKLQKLKTEKLKAEGGGRKTEDGTTFNLQHSTCNSQPTIFAYSYAARDIFRWARAQGWKTVLGQIDAGLPEERLVARLHDENPTQRHNWQPAPAEYWADWREECELADCIVVNSDWARRALLKQGVPAEKLAIIPLCYEPNAETLKTEMLKLDGISACQNVSLSAFSPLRVLFLGQVILRKGIQYLVEAAKLLENEPVHFDVVGPIGISEAAIKSAPANMKFHGRANRDEAAGWYARSDVFVLPTISDGFAITQIEAMAHGLPVIATPNCGEVVSDGVDGFIIPPRDAMALAKAIRRYLSEPELLRSQRGAALAKSKQFTLDKLSGRLLALEADLCEKAEKPKC